MPRPCVYDRNDLLHRATALFWERGFAGTSVDDLVRATGVNRSSLYSAYPDKSALYLAALEHYLDTVTRDNLQRLAEGARAAQAIRSFFFHVAEQRPQPNAPAHGCLVTNAAVEIGAAQAEVADRVRAGFARMESALAARLKEARQQGDLSEDTDPDQFARQLLVLLQGLRVMTRLGVEPRQLRDAVVSALAPLRTSDGDAAAAAQG